jgi:hypothetical protein
MSNFDHQGNPYQSPISGHTTELFGSHPPRQISIDPIGLLTRSYAGLGSQYWVFLAVSLVGMFVGSIVPMNILLGPMLVGVFLCAKDRLQGKGVEFGTLFRGFDYFLESLLVIIAAFVFSLGIFLAVFILMAIVLGGVIAVTGTGGDEPGPAFWAALLMCVPVFIAASLVCYFPFVFAFQLIADKKMKALDAVKLSFHAAWINRGGVVWYMLVVGIISLVLAMMCYLPLLFFIPIWLFSMFLLYRDVFPEYEVFPEDIVDARVI